MSSFARRLTAVAAGVLVTGGALAATADAAPPHRAMPQPRVLPQVTGRGIQTYNYNQARWNRPYNPNHMPGWDWWRTYPYSPYNYYNPYNYYSPYYYGRYPYAPIGYGYYTEPVSSSYAAPVDYGAGYGTTAPVEQTPLPYPTGQVKVAPRNAAVIEVRLPNAAATVSIDGQKVSSMGATRWYMSPELKGGREYTLTVATTRGGEPTTLERKVNVTPGQIVQVDFTRPALQGR
jgi:uncharacterized protein (TIGR03000 family)